MLSSLASILAAVHHLQLLVKAVVQVLNTSSVWVRFPGLLHLQGCAGISLGAAGEEHCLQRYLLMFGSFKIQCFVVACSCQTSGSD